MSTAGLYKNVKAYIPPVQSAYTAIIDNGDFFPPPVFKNDEEAEELLGCAMGTSEEGKYLTAFHLYADSLAKARSGGLVSRIYYERASTLEDTNYFHYSTIDNQRARNNDGEGSLREELDRQNQRLMLRTGEVSNFFFDIRPRLYGSNYNIQNSSVSFKLENRGNRFIAATHIQAGDRLIVEEAACIALLSEHNLFCYGCAKFCLILIPCLQCTKALFCNEDCRNYAWRHYHKYECKIISILEDVRYRLATRMALSLHDIIGLEGYPDPETIVINYGCLDALKAAETGPCISPTTADELADCAAHVFYAVKEFTDFFDAIDTPLKYDIFKGLLLKLMYVERTIAYQQTEKFEVTATSTMEVSFSAYYPNLCCVSHSCAPNTSMCYKDSTVEIRALRNIQPGEVITIAGREYHYTETKKEERQRIYKNRFFSDCQCEACKEDWPLLAQLVSRHPTNVALEIKDLYLRVQVNRLNPDIICSLFSELQSMAIRTKWITPSLEYASFDYTFRMAHRLMWRSVHSSYDFMRKFPNSM